MVIAHIIKLSGRLAHWRKYYSNMSSLSYYYPSRTNIIGIISSVLELSYDSYYSLFSSDNLCVALSLDSTIYKNTFTINYRSKKSGITQVIQEILFNESYNLSYLIYLVSENDQTEKLITKFIDKVKVRHFGYGVYLGQRQFKGDLEYIKSCEVTSVENIDKVDSICSKDNIFGKLDLDNPNKCYNLDTLPVDFFENRQLKDKKEFIAELNLQPIKVKEGHIKNVFLIDDKYISYM